MKKNAESQKKWLKQQEGAKRHLRKLKKILNNIAS